MRPPDRRRIIPTSLFLLPGRLIGATRARRSAPLSRDAVLRRTLRWGIVVICVVLAIATFSEAIAAANAQAQVSAAQARNAALRANTARAQRAARAAASPDTIEREARHWGYTRPGEHPVIVVTPTPSPPSR